MTAVLHSTSNILLTDASFPANSPTQRGFTPAMRGQHTSGSATRRPAAHAPELPEGTTNQFIVRWRNSPGGRYSRSAPPAHDAGRSRHAQTRLLDPLYTSTDIDTERCAFGLRRPVAGARHVGGQPDRHDHLKICTSSRNNWGRPQRLWFFGLRGRVEVKDAIEAPLPCAARRIGAGDTGMTGTGIGHLGPHRAAAEAGVAVLARSPELGTRTRVEVAAGESIEAQRRTPGALGQHSAVAVEPALQRSARCHGEGRSNDYSDYRLLNQYGTITDGVMATRNHHPEPTRSASSSRPDPLSSAACARL